MTAEMMHEHSVQISRSCGGWQSILPPTVRVYDALGQLYFAVRIHHVALAGQDACPALLDALDVIHCLGTSFRSCSKSSLDVNRKETSRWVDLNSRRSRLDSHSHSQ